MRTFCAFLLTAAVELCLCCALTPTARAQFAPFYGTQPSLPPPTGSSGGCPRAVPFPELPSPPPAPLPPAPLPPVPPPQPAPPPLPPPTEAERPPEQQPETPPSREQQPAPQQPQPDQQQQPQQPATTPGEAGEEGDAFASAADTGEAAAAEGGGGGGGPAASGAGDTSMLGRGDSANRFNLFDNNSAFTRNRVWAGYQHLDSFQTGIGIDPSSQAITNSFARRRDENLYRVGAEVVPFASNAYESRLSLSFQTQYIASTDTDNSADAWGTPEIIIKYALLQGPCCVLSALVGIEPQVSTNLYELHEKTTRVLPGLLFYDALTCRLFLQGGLQFNIAERDAPSTFDWGLSAGYWLYADESLFNSCPATCSRPTILGIIPQVELYGKDVMSHDTSNPYDIPADPTVLGGPLAPYQEPRNVIDFTGGLRVLFGCGLTLSAGGSVPLTGGQARRAEFLTYLSYCF
jgi:hypothetical protein